LYFPRSIFSLNKAEKVSYRSSSPIQYLNMVQMKAVHYEGPFKVSVKEIPRPKLEHPDDAIIKVTTSGMSLSSDLFKAIILRFVQQQFADPIYTCTKAAQPQKQASSLGERNSLISPFPCIS